MVPIPFLKAGCPDHRPTKLGMKEMLHLTGTPPSVPVDPEIGWTSDSCRERGSTNLGPHTS